MMLSIYYAIHRTLQYLLVQVVHQALQSTWRQPSSNCSHPHPDVLTESEHTGLYRRDGEGNRSKLRWPCRLGCIDLRQSLPWPVLTAVGDLQEA